MLPDFKRFLRTGLALGVLALPIAHTPSLRADPDSRMLLRLFAGGPSQRPDLLRSVLDEYERVNPLVRVEIGIGGATSELQRKYLTALLNGADSYFDGLLLDIVSPAQFASAGWLEPLDAYLGPEGDSAFADFLPVYREIDRFAERWIALPSDTSALFLYYRRDLLERYQKAVPTDWNELAATASEILRAEGNPRLKGLSFQGAPIEGTVATFLIPYWSQGGQFLDAAGRLSLDRTLAENALSLWTGLVARGVAPRNSAEVKTGDTVNEFAAGQAIFALNWGFANEVFQNPKISRVTGAYGIAPIPAYPGGDRVTTLGGYQWALSAFSRHKPETARLLLHLVSPQVSRRLVLGGYSMPARLSLYRDPQILAARPWLAVAEAIVRSGIPRPVTPRYAELSETLRRSTSAAIAGATTPSDAVAEMERRLSRVLK